MKRFIPTTLLLCFLLVSIPTTALGQTSNSAATHFSILEIDIRPEFDNPEVLVIYHIVLTPDTKFPATVSIPIPARVRAPSAVAWVDPTDGSMYTLTYQSRVENNQLYITFSTTGNEIQLEYYDPNLLKNGITREYTFDWIGGFDIDDFSIHIQQPVGAMNVILTPNLGDAKVSDDGIVYYYSKLGQISAGNDFSVNMRYDKTTSELSVEQLPVQPSAPINDQTMGRTSLNEVLPWIIGLLLIILAGSIGWWIWISRHSSHARVKRKNRHSTLLKMVKNGEREGNHTYCHQCGQRAVHNDLFCRTCGTKLRRS